MLCCFFINEKQSYFLNIEMVFDYVVKIQEVNNFKKLFEKSKNKNGEISEINYLYKKQYMYFFVLLSNFDKINCYFIC